jgi:hypothetical protein
MYRTIILPVVWYGFESWSLTLREEQRWRVFEIRVLRKTFGENNSEELTDLHSSPSIIQVIKLRRI